MLTADESGEYLFFGGGDKTAGEVVKRSGRADIH